MSDSDLLHFFTARLVGRENAAISFVTIAASASLIFLGVVLNNNNPQDIGFEYVLLGISIPSIALAYNEITRLGIHKDDHEKINELLEKILGKEKWDKVETKIKNRKHRKKRLFLVRIIFLSPVLGWLFIIPYSFVMRISEHFLFDILSVFVVFVIALCLVYAKDLPDK